MFLHAPCHTHAYAVLLDVVSVVPALLHPSASIASYISLLVVDVLGRERLPHVLLTRGHIPLMCVAQLLRYRVESPAHHPYYLADQHVDTALTGTRHSSYSLWADASGVKNADVDNTRVHIAYRKVVPRLPGCCKCCGAAPASWRPRELLRLLFFYNNAALPIALSDTCFSFSTARHPSINFSSHLYRSLFLQRLYLPFE